MHEITIVVNTAAIGKMFSAFLTMSTGYETYPNIFIIRTVYSPLNKSKSCMYVGALPF